jgi:hypothetical protein
MSFMMDMLKLVCTACFVISLCLLISLIAYLLLTNVLTDIDLGTDTY